MYGCVVEWAVYGSVYNFMDSLLGWWLYGAWIVEWMGGCIFV